VIVEKKGRPFAVLISPEDFARFQTIAKERFFEIAQKSNRTTTMLILMRCFVM